MDSDRAGKYRQQAAECLEAAQTVTDPRIKDKLVLTAQSWQRLAQNIERRNELVGAGAPDYPPSRLTRFVSDGPIISRIGDDETGQPKQLVRFRIIGTFRLGGLLRKFDPMIGHFQEKYFVRQVGLLC